MTVAKGPAEGLGRGMTSGPRQQPRRDLCLYQGSGPEVPAVLLCDKGHVEQGRAPAPRLLVDRHLQGAHGPQRRPQVGIVT